MENGNLLKVIASAAVLLALVSGVVALNSGVRTQVDVLRTEQLTIMRELRGFRQAVHQVEKDNAYEWGRIQQRVSDLAESTQQLDIDLQREMRDVNAQTEAKLIGLDTRLQSEITNITGVLQNTIAKMETQVTKNQEWQSIMRENIARIGERMKNVDLSMK